MSANTGPIADLTYRNYDGPKGVAGARWWAIARNGIRISLKKKGFWVLLIFSSMPYLLLMFFAFMQSSAGRFGNEFGNFSSLLSGVYNTWYGHLLLALLVGAGAIAADNRANALQVYLAKPITKNDYLLGKLSYIFIVMFGAYFAPMLLATLYSAFSTGWAEFLREQPLLFVKLIPLAAIPAMTYACGIVGLSAWNKTTWLVGVIFAGLFIFSDQLARVLAFTMSKSDPQTVTTVQLLHIDGAMSGVGQWIIGERPRGSIGGADFFSSTLPNPWPLLLLLVCVWVLGILAARLRIRAVEVVQG